MSKAVRIDSHPVLCAALAVGTMLALLSGALFADTMESTPNGTVLYAEARDVLAVMPMPIRGGYLLTTANGTLSLNGEVVAEARSIRYSYLEDSLLISFDRDELLSNSSVRALAATGITATVEGSFTAANSDGDSYKQVFRGVSRKLLTS